MIIEVVKMNGRDVFLLHYDLKEGLANNVRNVYEALMFIGATVPVPNGHPCPTNPLPKITLYNSKIEGLSGVIEKISKASAGEFIPLSAEEMDLLAKSQTNGNMVQL